MNNNEIKGMLKQNNGYLYAEQIKYIMDTSNQLDHIIFENDHYDMWSNDGEYFKIKVKEK